MTGPEWKKLLTSLFYKQYTAHLPIKIEPFLKSTLKGVCANYRKFSKSEYIQDVIDTANYGTVDGKDILAKKPYLTKNKELITGACVDTGRKMGEIIDDLSIQYGAIPC